MKIGTIQTAKLKTIVNMTIKCANIHDFPLRFDEDGLRIQAIDPSHIAMIDFIVPKTEFGSYDVKQTIMIVIESSDLSKIVKSFKSEDTTLEYDGVHKQFTLISGNIMLDVPLVSSEEKLRPAPQLEYEALINLSASDLIAAVDAVSIMHDIIKIKTDKDNLVFYNNSERRGAHISHPHGIKKCDSFESMFDIDYLSSSVKSIPAESIEIGIGSDMPIMLKFKFFEGSNGTYMVAPRVDAD